MSSAAPLPQRIDHDAPVFVISVAAQLAGMHPQTLRTYDRMGLVSPRRTAKRGRRYSARDIAQLRLIQRLSQDEGINLEGIRRILRMQDEIDELRSHLRDLSALLSAARAAPPGRAGLHRRSRPAACTSAVLLAARPLAPSPADSGRPGNTRQMRLPSAFVVVLALGLCGCTSPASAPQSPSPVATSSNPTPAASTAPTPRRHPDADHTADQEAEAAAPDLHGSADPEEVRRAQPPPRPADR